MTYFKTATESRKVFDEQFENGVSPSPARHEQAGIFKSRLNETGFFALTLQRIGHQLTFLTALYEKATDRTTKSRVRQEIEDIINGGTISGVGSHVGTKAYTFTTLAPTITGYTKNTSGVSGSKEIINGVSTGNKYFSIPTVSDGVIEPTLENYSKDLGYIDGGFETDPGFGMILVGYTNILANPTLLSSLKPAVRTHVEDGAKVMFQKLAVYYAQNPKFTEKSQATSDFDFTHTTIARLAENYGFSDLQIFDTGIATDLSTTHEFKAGTGVINTIYTHIASMAYYLAVGLGKSKSQIKTVETSELLSGVSTNSPLRTGQLNQYFEQFPDYLNKIGNPTTFSSIACLALGVGGVSQTFALTSCQISSARLTELGVSSVSQLNSSSPVDGNTYYSQDHMRGFLGSNGYDSYVSMALVWLSHASGTETVTDRYATASQLSGTAFTIAKQIGHEYRRKLSNKTLINPIAMHHASKSDDGLALTAYLGQFQNYIKNASASETHGAYLTFVDFVDKINSDNPEPTGFLYSFASNGDADLFKEVDDRVIATGEFDNLNNAPADISAVRGYIQVSPKTSHRGIHGLAGLLERGITSNTVSNGIKNLNI